jgi:hypothetical protein
MHVAIVGCGQIARMHSAALQRVDITAEAACDLLAAGRSAATTGAPEASR